MEKVKDRFIKKVNIKTSNECWEWNAGYRSVYGGFKFNGKTIDAHRMSYMLFKGEIPEKMFVCHTCDNTKCVNPEHLFLGTHSDNMKDAFNKGRLNIPTSGRFKDGHIPKNRKISNDEVIKIKSLLINRNITLKNISEQLNIPYHIIVDINNNRSYVD